MGQIDVIMAGLDKFTEERMIALGLEVTANLQEETPVDIGWARAGWVPSVGKPYTGGADLDPDPGKVQIALARQAAGQSELLAFTIDAGDVFCTNNVPYIERLNEGHSTQAPAGFVQSAIVRAVRTVG